MGVMKMGLEGLIGVDLPIPTRWYGKTTEKNPRLSGVRTPDLPSAKRNRNALVHQTRYINFAESSSHVNYINNTCLHFLHFHLHTYI
jgi:hypothetical protein